MIKPEHQEDCKFIYRAIFSHELSTKKVYHEGDLVRDYFKIKQKIEGVFDGLDVNAILKSGIF